MPDDGTRDAVLGLLGLALRAGALRLGAGPVMRALQHERPGVVFVAQDAGKDVATRVARAKGASTVNDTLLDSADLARAFGRDKLSVVSVHDKDFVSGVIQHLSQPR